MNHLVALLLAIDELPLIGGADVQLAAVTPDALLLLVSVALDKLTYSDVLQFDFHCQFSVAGRILINEFLNAVGSAR